MLNETVRTIRGFCRCEIIESRVSDPEKTSRLLLEVELQSSLPVGSARCSHTGATERFILHGTGKQINNFPLIND